MRMKQINGRPIGQRASSQSMIQKERRQFLTPAPTLQESAKLFQRLVPKPQPAPHRDQNAARIPPKFISGVYSPAASAVNQKGKAEGGRGRARKGEAAGWLGQSLRCRRLSTLGHPLRSCPSHPQWLRALPLHTPPSPFSLTPCRLPPEFLIRPSAALLLPCLPCAHRLPLCLLKSPSLPDQLARAKRTSFWIAIGKP
jgi:hypothetical protein